VTARIEAWQAGNGTNGRGSNGYAKNWEQFLGLSIRPLIKKEAAEARLKEIEVLRAEIALLDDLKKAGVILREAEALARNRVPRR
jgi:hypothetical protein